MTPVVKDWLLNNSVPIIGAVVVLVGLYLAVGRVDSYLAERNAELRGQVQNDIATAQTEIKKAVSDAEKHIKEAQAAEGIAGTNASKGKANADAAAKKKMTDMVNDWNQ